MSGTTLNKAFVPLAGGSTAVYNSSGLAYYRHSDWLGSSRLASTRTRGVYFDTAYGPFGEAYASTGTSDLSFTGMNQDTASNVYDFPAREYGIQGRWPSPDPAGLAAVDLSDPQTLNRYAYVRNSPLHMVDPSGLDPCDEDGNCGGGGGSGCPDNICGNPGDPGCCDGPGPVQNLFGNSVVILPPIGLPGQGPPGTTPSTFPTGPGVDWTSILFGPPDSSLLIFNFCVNTSGKKVSCDTLGSIDCSNPDNANVKGCSGTPWWQPFVDRLNTYKLQTEAFAQAAATNFKNEWQNGCVSVFLDGFSEGGLLPDGSPGSGVDDAIKKGGDTAAAAWTVGRGLVVPLRSPYVRFFTRVAKFGEGLGAVDIFLKSANGAVDEAKSALNGTCR